ncbi:MAG: hypothetical protein ABFC56_03770, partial [Clostridiaceae bacterium]
MLAVFYVFRSSARAEGEDTSAGAGDVTATVPLTAPDGEATVNEYTEHGGTGNQAGDLGSEDDRTFENDLPSVTTTTIEKLDSTGTVTDTTVTNTLTQTGESVDLEEPTTVTSGNTQVTESGDTRTTVTISASDNAIQKAVDKVLAELSPDSASATIRVAAGTYNGDINITAGASVAEDFVLYILADDSFETPAEGALIDKTTIGTQGSGAADVTGNVNIDGVNVVLAGLYLSLEKIVNAKNAAVTVYGTERDDAIHLNLEGDSTGAIHGGAGNDQLMLSGTGGATGTGTLGTATVSGGDGDDTINVDTGLAKNASGVSVAGGAGIDRLHLTGTLKQGGTSSATIGTGGLPQIHLQDESESALDFVLNGIENYTDALQNKTRVSISAAEIASGSYTASLPFVDYTLAAADLPALSAITINGSGFLAGLIIDGNTYTIHSLTASGLNVTLNGKDITVDGIVRVANLIINAVDSDVQLSLSADDLPDGVVPESLPIDGSASVDFSIMDIVAKAVVNITATAHIYAGGSVSISAESTQTQPLIPLVGTGFNLVNVKVGSATISILGIIESGGNLDASAKTKVVAEASNTSLAKFFIPFAVGVVVASSDVTLGASGWLKAAGSVNLLSQTDVTLKVRSTAGKLPISLAVSVAIVDAHVNVLGDVTAQSGSITLKSAGTTAVQTLASNKAPETSNTTSSAGTNSTGGTGGSAASGNSFGGFFAVSVVLQSVDAIVAGAADLSAGKDISILSSASERVLTKATSADPVAAGVSSAPSQSVSSMQGIVSGLFTKIKTVLTGSAAGAFAKGEGSFNGADGYAITSESTQHGTITAPAKVKGGENATVKVTPDSGYVLEALTYTYLPAGQSAYVTRSVNISGAGDSYTFVMPEAAVKVTAVFRQRTAEDPDPSTGNLFDEEEEDDSLGIGGLFDEGTSGSESDGTVTQSGDLGDDFTITVSPDLANGALVISAQKADAGKEIVITVNPAKDFQLKADTLKATTQLEGRTSIQTIAKNTAGQYVLTMPAGNVTLNAEFEAVPAGTTPTTTPAKTSSSSVQATGALAVAVSRNANLATINTTGTITAGGTLKLNADASTQSSLLADGSPVGTAAGESNDPMSEANAGTDAQDTDEVTQEQTATMANGRPVVVSSTLNGTVNFRSTSTTEDKAAFGYTARQGYKLAVDGLKYSYTDPTTGLVEGTLTAGSGGSYYIALPAALPKDVTLTISATFEAETYQITLPASGVTGPASAKRGDSVELTVAQQAGKTAAVTATGATVTEADGKYNFIMPGADVTVSVAFTEKQTEVELTGDALTFLTASDTRVNTGEKVTFSLTSAGTASGKKLDIAVKAFYLDIASGDYVEDDTITITVVDNAFTVPTTIGPNHKLVVSVAAENKAHAVTVTTPTNGTITAPAFVNGGETITITVTPTAGFKLKPGSLTVKTVEGSVEATAPVAADANGNYTYKVPVPVGGDTKPMTLTIAGAFIKDPSYTGQPATNQQKKSFSLGVGIAIAVTLHKNEATIQNGTITVGSLELCATSGSEAEQLVFAADAKAGYSQGDFGLAGAVTVHVASAKTRAIIGDKAAITLAEAG